MLVVAFLALLDGETVRHLYNSSYSLVCTYNNLFFSHSAALFSAARGGSAEQVVVTDLPKRRASVAGGSPSAMQGPEPVVVDNFPKRRASVARPGGGSLAGLQVEGTPGAGTYDDDVSTMPASPEMLRQTSEMELLQTADSLGVVREGAVWPLTKRS